jgi:predicted O-methyltransferase YrrM
MINATRQALLEELAEFGWQNDRQVLDRREKMLNITPDTGALLALLVRATKAGRVLEIGTSNGYSTIWLADAVESLGGLVTTVEALPVKADLARKNFDRAGLTSSIDVHVGEAGAYLRQLGPDSFNFIFLDSDRTKYVAWWRHLQKILAGGGLLVADNAVSHAAEMVDFCMVVAATPGFMRVLVPIGNGELILFKEASSPQS